MLAFPRRAGWDFLDALTLALSQRERELYGLRHGRLLELGGERVGVDGYAVERGGLLCWRKRIGRAVRRGLVRAAISGWFVVG